MGPGTTRLREWTNSSKDDRQFNVEVDDAGVTRRPRFVQLGPMGQVLING